MTRYLRRSSAGLHALLIGTLLIGLAGALASPARGDVTITEIAAPSGTIAADFGALNDVGVVVFRTSSQNWIRHPDGTYEPVVPPAGFTNTFLGRINESGAIVGSATIGQTTTRAVIRQPDGTYTFPLPNTQSSAAGINDAGTLVGKEPTRIFVWRPGSGVTYVPAPPGSSPASSPQAVAINNSDTTIGLIGVPPPVPQPGLLIVRGFRYTPASGSVLLPTTGSDPTEAADINDAGVIVGTVGGLGADIRPAKWLADNTLVELVPPRPSGIVVAQGINSLGDIVGHGPIAGFRAILWSDDFGSVDLNDLLSPDQRAHWLLRLAFDVNDNRQVIGSGHFDPDGPGGPAAPENRLFLLNLPPIPEPSLGLLVPPALALLRRARVATRVRFPVSN